VDKSLNASYRAFLEAQDAFPAEARYVPEDGVCETCDKLKRDHPGVERMLAIRKLKYFDPEKGVVVFRGGIPYCKCNEIVRVQQNTAGPSRPRYPD